MPGALEVPPSPKTVCAWAAFAKAHGCCEIGFSPYSVPTALDQSNAQTLARAAGLELCKALDTEIVLSQQSKRALCESSVMLQLIWNQFLKSCEDPAFVKLALEVGEPLKTPREAICFSVQLARVPHKTIPNRFGFGLWDVSSAAGDVLVVIGILRGSPVEVWNDQCCRQRLPWKRLLLYSVVVSVNGIAGDCGEMRRELACGTNVVLCACNPPSLTNALTLARAFQTASPVPAFGVFWPQIDPIVGSEQVFV